MGGGGGDVGGGGGDAVGWFSLLEFHGWAIAFTSQKKQIKKKMVDGVGKQTPKSHHYQTTPPPKDQEIICFRVWLRFCLYLKEVKAKRVSKSEWSEGGLGCMRLTWLIGFWTISRCLVLCLWYGLNRLLPLSLSIPRPHCTAVFSNAFVWPALLIESSRNKWIKPLSFITF